MHEAYKTITIVEKLPVSIESVAVCDFQSKTTNDSDHSKEVFMSKVLIGTKGHLYVYKVNPQVQYARGVEATFLGKYKQFSQNNKPIIQLFATNEFDIILSLSGGLVSIHRLDNYEKIATVSKTKGASYFSAGIDSQVSSTGVVAYEMKLCVSVRRTLQFYFWKNGEFSQLHSDVQLPETPKSLAWCKDSVCVALKREYLLVQLSGDITTKGLSPTGKSPESVICLVGTNEIALQRDENSVFFNCAGEITYNHMFTWSETPIAVASHPPYLLSVMNNLLEVRTMHPRMFVQSIDLSKPKNIYRYHNWVIVSSSSSIWMLQQLPASKQLPALLQAKEYELALQIAKLSKWSTEKQKISTIEHIEILNAFDLFQQRKFYESLESFLVLLVDPHQVIGLFSDLLPEKQQNKLKYPEEIDKMHGTELENGIIALTEFLTKKRIEMLKSSSSSIHNLKSIMPSNNVIKSRKSLLTIIDTSLLKCFLKTNDAMVGPLLRVENYCHLEESEKVLKKMSKTRELIELYKRKNKHEKALMVLSERLKNFGHASELVEYLQHLGIFIL